MKFRIIIHLVNGQQIVFVITGNPLEWTKKLEEDLKQPGLLFIEESERRFYAINKNHLVDVTCEEIGYYAGNNDLPY
jgi:hypothetical protein